MMRRINSSPNTASIIAFTLVISTILSGCSSVETSTTRSSSDKDTGPRIVKNVPQNERTRGAVGLSQVAYSDLAALATSSPSSVLTYGDDALQRIYHWQANRNAVSPSSGAGAVIYIHGGCWLNAYDYAHASGLYNALQEKGMSVYALEYRRTGDAGGGWPGSLNDVKSGINAALKHIAVKGQHDTVFVVGHSAGGHLALLSTDVLEQKYHGVRVEAIVGVAAITDITSYANGKNSCQSATSAFMSATPDENPALYVDATPVITNTSIPVMLLQGDADTIVPKKHAFLEGAKAVIVSNGGHFDWLHPQSTSFDALLNVFGEHNE